MNQPRRQPALPGLSAEDIDRKMFETERLPLITSQIQAFAEDLEEAFEESFDENLPKDLQEKAHYLIERTVASFVARLSRSGSVDKLARRQRLALACALGYRTEIEAA